MIFPHLATTWCEELFTNECYNVGHIGSFDHFSYFSNQYAEKTIFTFLFMSETRFSHHELTPKFYKSFLNLKFISPWQHLKHGKFNLHLPMEMFKMTINHYSCRLLPDQ